MHSPHKERKEILLQYVFSSLYANWNSSWKNDQLNVTQELLGCVSYPGCKKARKEGRTASIVLKFTLFIFLEIPWKLQLRTHGISIWFSFPAKTGSSVSQCFLLVFFPWKVLTQIYSQTAEWYCWTFLQIWKKMGQVGLQKVELQVTIFQVKKFTFM